MRAILDEDIITCPLDGETDLGLHLYPQNPTATEFKYESSNDKIAYVDDNGKLIKVSEGIVTIKATHVESGIYAEVTISISNSFNDSKVLKAVHNNGKAFALLEDGSVWYWSNTILVPTQLDLENVTDIAIKSYSELFYIKDNVLYTLKLKLISSLNLSCSVR